MAKVIVIVVVFTVAIIATADILQACRLIEIHIHVASNTAIRKPAALKNHASSCRV